jgi:hypothetical protein
MSYEPVSIDRRDYLSLSDWTEYLEVEAKSDLKQAEIYLCLARIIQELQKLQEEHKVTSSTATTIANGIHDISNRLNWD